MFTSIAICFVLTTINSHISRYIIITRRCPQHGNNKVRNTHTINQQENHTSLPRGSYVVPFVSSLPQIRQFWGEITAVILVLTSEEYNYMCIVYVRSTNTPSVTQTPRVSYPTMHYFATEVCMCGHISVTKRCIVWYLSNAFIVICDWSLRANRSSGNKVCPIYILYIYTL